MCAPTGFRRNPPAGIGCPQGSSSPLLSLRSLSLSLSLQHPDDGRREEGRDYWTSVNDNEPTLGLAAREVSPRPVLAELRLETRGVPI